MGDVLFEALEKAARIIPIAMIGLKWAAVVLLHKTNPNIQAFGGGLFSASLGGAGANSDFYAGFAFLIDIFIVLALLFEDRDSDREPKNFGTIVAIVYFAFNAYAGFSASFGSETTVGKYSQDAGMLLSLILLSPLAVALTTMTFWLPVWMYLVFRFTEPLFENRRRYER